MRDIKMKGINMKVIKALTILSVVMAVMAITSCDMLALGEQINMDGPVVTIEKPEPRQPVDGKFFISGTVTDNVGIDRMEIKARYSTDEGNKEFPMQWRFTGSRWEVSLNSGKNWSSLPSVVINEGTDDEETVNAEWNGDLKSASWVVPVNLLLRDDVTVDGQYQFTVTAWNIAKNSDDNSIKTRNVILYEKKPTVGIIYPILYNKEQLDFGGTLQELYELESWEEPAYIGRLLNGSFNLQWQIEEKNELKSLDIRFYETHDDNGDLINPLEMLGDEYVNKDDYVFKMTINSSMLRPNGRMEVSNLTETGSGKIPEADYSIDWEVKKPITEKTVLQILVQCVNAADLYEEKLHGCFVYWPDSDKPWITFPESLSSDWSQPLYTVFPGSQVPVKAYDDDGVDYIKYSIYPVNAAGVKDGAAVITVDRLDNPLKNTNFSWAFDPPEAIATFLIEAEVFDINSPPLSTTRSGYFKTLDISWPEIKAPYTPDSTRPLYQKLNTANPADWNFEIKGIASDASEIDSIYMVWINPHSSNYLAMSQLAYFRDPEYEGWVGAEAHYAANPSRTDPYYDGAYDPEDATKHNKVWKLGHIPNPEHNPPGLHPITRRTEVEYSKILSLRTDLNIAPGQHNTAINRPYDYLKSQVFVLKVTGGSKEKSHIIVWSPEGSSLAPTVRITGVSLQRGSSQPINLDITKVDEIDPFITDDKITITGTWSEDSARFLTVDQALRNFND
ncbi:MAG: hypothetical protein LBU66_05660, partial [Treponema sp.]|nr:hypothetical protein [Treponema sp.]